MVMFIHTGRGLQPDAHEQVVERIEYIIQISCDPHL